jgi:aspartyl-tRNA(Asn)/glutamyl-tRNA(Gln) amidotransferase subunit A
MKGTFGRIPRGPHAFMRPNTVVLGNLARSVRDAARYFDVCSGYHPTDPSSLPKHQSYEAGLGTHDLKGKRVAVIPNLGGVPLDPGVEEHLREEADALIASTGMARVDLDVQVPNLAAQWMMGNLATLLADLGNKWPGCASDMTPEVSAGLYMSQSLFYLRTAAVAEGLRVEANEAMAAAFDHVDFLISSTNPGPAFPAEAAMSSSDANFLDWAKSSAAATYLFRSLLFGTRLTSVFAPKLPSALLAQAARVVPDVINMGGLTIVSNIYGNPAVSIPAGTLDGLPVGLQVQTRHHHDELLFDVALAVERERPWPLVAPSPARVAASRESARAR